LYPNKAKNTVIRVTNSLICDSNGVILSASGPGVSLETAVRAAPERTPGNGRESWCLMASNGLNGWTPQYASPTREHLIDCMKDDDIVRVMEIAPSTRPGRASSTCHAFEFNPITSPLRITIREGTTKRDALAALANALATVQEDWDSIIKDTPAGFDIETKDDRLDRENEKSGTPETPASPTSGIKREVKASTRTAA
jgi:hypothetical protein